MGVWLNKRRVRWRGLAIPLLTRTFNEISKIISTEFKFFVNVLFVSKNKRFNLVGGMPQFLPDDSMDGLLLSSQQDGYWRKKLNVCGNIKILNEFYVYLMCVRMILFTLNSYQKFSQKKT